MKESKTNSVLPVTRLNAMGEKRLLKYCTLVLRHLHVMLHYTSTTVIRLVHRLNDITIFQLFPSHFKPETEHKSTAKNTKYRRLSYEIGKADPILKESFVFM